MDITQINVVQSDTGYDLGFTLQDSDGVAVNITGATILFNAQKQNDPSLRFSGGMSIVSAVAGNCKYAVQSTDFVEAGKYIAEIQVTIGSQILTWPGIVINVKPQLPK